MRSDRYDGWFSFGPKLDMDLIFLGVNRISICPFWKQGLEFRIVFGLN